MKGFPHGASYYPLMEKNTSVWEKDLETMKEAGINFIRTAEIFNGWDQLEIKPGVFRFDELKVFFDLCSQYDIEILLGSGSTCPPYWLHQMDETVNVLSSNGKRYPVNASYGWACYNNPTFRERHAIYLAELVKYFKEHDALLAYQINNELGYPFIPLGTGDIDVYCYCEHCKNEFREWVKNKYETLENLNHAWRWGATNTYHTSWDQVEPPYTKPTAWASVTRWLDWRLFHMEVMTNQVKREELLIKSLDQNHFTTLNIFYLNENDPLSTLTAIDQFELAKVVDIIGYDVYPGSFNKLEDKPENSSMVLDHARSVTKPLNKNYWLAETEAGPIGGWVLGPDRTTNHDDIFRYQMDAIGHDAKSVMYQLYKEYEFQPLHWGGIVNLDGSKTERTDAVRKVSDFVEQYADFIENATTKKGRVALLVSKENQIVLNGVNQDGFFVKELRGVYSAFHEMGYEIDFIIPEHLENGYAKDYILIYAPLLAVVQEKLTDHIASYVKMGGTFIASARYGYMEEHGWYAPNMPSYESQAMFGINVVNVYKETDISIDYDGRAYDGYHHIEQIEKTTATEYATFKNGWPAVTKNKFGKGQAIYIGTHLGHAYYENQDNLLKRIIKKVSPCLPRIITEYEGKKMREIDVHSLSNDKTEILIITNYVGKEYKDTFFENPLKHITISHEDHSILSIKQWGCDKSIEFSNDGRVMFNIEIEKDKVTILILQKG